MRSSFVALAKELFAEYRHDETPRHAAAVAYYTVFSLPAFILIILSIAGATLDSSIVNQEVFNAIRLYLGENTAQFLQDALGNIQQNSTDTSWIAWWGVILLVVAGTGVIRELQNSMNRILNQKSARKGLSRHVRRYLLSLFLLVITAVIVIASIISGTLLNIMSGRIAGVFSLPIDLLSLAHNVITYLTMIAMIFLLFVYLPEKRFPRFIAFLSSVITGSILVIGMMIASYYVSQTGIGQAYGVAANVLILLFLIYFGANVFLFGVEIMEVADRLQAKDAQRPINRLKRLLHL